MMLLPEFSCSPHLVVGSTIFPQINHVRSIHSRSTNCPSTIRGRGLIEGAVYFIQQATRVVLIIWACAIDFQCLFNCSPPTCQLCGSPAAI